jgi:cation diffusion facilitator CzcD-associated flavoprotein CzcO
LEQVAMQIAIIGAGMSGILCAIRLREEGYDDIVIYEKGDSVGGTWRENRYRGLSCDIPSHVYSYSFAPNPDWSFKYSPGLEIHEYFKRVANDYDVTSHVRFNCEIIRAQFDGKSWHLWSETEELPSVHVVLAATGILHHPRMPDIDGIEQFQGPAFHTARWPDALDLRGQRVGIIGTGSTAIQIVSDIVGEVSSLRLFQRTAQWIWPEANTPYSDDDKARFRDDPGILPHMRKRMSQQIDAHFSDALVDADGPAMRQLEAECLRNLDEHIRDPALKRKLTPDYRAGCKRLIMSDTFYPAIQQSHADVVTEGVARIEAAGVRADDGVLHELDVLVLATGFNAHQFMRPMHVEGPDGTTLEQLWSDYVYAYRSIALPQLPNFFMLMGPQSPVGNFSLIDVAEIQFDYIAQLLAPIRDGRCKAVAPAVAATREFTDDVAAAMHNTIWVTGCSSWYLDERGVPITWPWTVHDFDESMRTVEWADYQLLA